MLKIILILITLFSSAIHAENWVINDQHTQVQFKIGYMGVMEVSGLFTKVRGKFEYDPTTKQAKNILFQIATNSIQTHNKKRDGHLKRSDFFYAKQFPWIEASIDSIKLEQKEFKTNINLNIKENLKSVPVTVTVIGIKNDPWDESKQSLFLKISGKVDRKEFGLTWNKKMDQGGYLLSDDVSFTVNVEANPSDQKLAFSRFFLPTGQKPKYTQVDAKKIDKDLEDKFDFSEVDQEADKVQLSPKNNTNPASVIIGFVIFILITGLSIYIKIKLQKMLIDKRLSTIKAEIISDLILLAFVLVAFALTAPLMGYGN